MSTESAEVVRYRIEAKRSRFIVRAFSAGMLSALGHNPTIAIRQFTGEAGFLPGTLESASLRVTVDAKSLAVTDEMSDKDRREIERVMHEEVLETEKHPEISYESQGVTCSKIFEGQYRANINGKLSLHGVTRNLPIEARVIVSEDTLRATGEFTLRQTDFGIKPPSVVGGTIKLKDELKLSFDVAANRDRG